VQLKFGDFVVIKIFSTTEVKAALVTWGKTQELIVQLSFLTQILKLGRFPHEAFVSQQKFNYSIFDSPLSGSAI
jgi:hypothetical protein